MSFTKFLPIRKRHIFFGGMHISARENAYKTGAATPLKIEAKYQGGDVSVFRAYDPLHAIFIAQVSDNYPDIFPEVIGIRGSWVISRKPAGLGQSSASVINCFETLRAISCDDLSDLSPAGFNYFFDVVCLEFMEASMLYGVADSANVVINRIRNCKSPVRMSHCAIFPRNTVSRKGQVKVIDNTSLCAGRLPMLDACNTAKHLSRSDKRKFWSLWFSRFACSEEEFILTSLAWMVSEVSSSFRSLDFKNCNMLLRVLTKENVEYLASAKMINALNLHDFCSPALHTGGLAGR